MKLYHGSTQTVEVPRIVNRFKTLDFGEGFYVTGNEMQAKEFALKAFDRRKAGLPTVNVYEFANPFSDYNVKEFMSPDYAWLDFVVANRRGENLSKNYDIVSGPVANDDVFATIALYEGGQLTKDEAINRFKVKELFTQTLFANEEVLRGLAFIDAYTVEGKND